MRLPNVSFGVQLFTGTLDDLGIMLSTDGDDGVPTLHALVGRRWLKPFPLNNVSAITSTARVGDATWLLAGRKRDGSGLAALYRPLDWELEPLPSPVVRAYLACGGHPDISIGLVGGADGVVLYLDERGAWVESVPESKDISAAVVDAAGTCWTGGAGRIWLRKTDPSSGEPRWECAWEDSSWHAPIVSLFADVGLVMGVTADGAIVEGRPAELELHTLISAPPPHT
jgi:hypothetical protein